VELSRRASPDWDRNSSTIEMRMAVDERTLELSIDAAQAFRWAARTEASDVDFFGKVLAGEQVRPGPFGEQSVGRVCYRLVPAWTGTRDRRLYEPDEIRRAVVVDASSRASGQLIPVPLDAVCLQERVWSPRLQVNRDVTLPRTILSKRVVSAQNRQN
jgi:hypothetical protein